MYRIPAILSALCALSYIGTGVFFLSDPSSAHPNGSDAYWQALAEGSLARSGFLFCFGAAGLLALGVIPALRRMLAIDETRLSHWGCTLGLVGYAVTSVTYFRLLAGEPTRAAAVAGGSEEVRAAILSFSISLDTQGWLIFGCVAAFLLLVNGHALRSGGLPRMLALLGLLCGVLYAVAFAGLLLAQPDLVKTAAAVGGVALGPVWWLWVGWRLWRA